MTVETDHGWDSTPNAVGILIDMKEAVKEYRLALARSGVLNQTIVDQQTGTFIRVEVSNA
jgi:hypothetical protein